MRGVGGGADSETVGDPTGGGSPARSAGGGPASASGGDGSNGGSEGGGGGAGGGGGTAEVSDGAAQATTADDPVSEQAEGGESSPVPSPVAPQTVALAAEQTVPSDDQGVGLYLLGAGAFLVLAAGAGFVWWRGD